MRSECVVRGVENTMRARFPDQRGPSGTEAEPIDAIGVRVTVHSYGELWI